MAQNSPAAAASAHETQAVSSPWAVVIEELSARLLGVGKALADIWGQLPTWFKLTLAILACLAVLWTTLRFFLGRKRLKLYTRRLLEFGFKAAASINHNYGTLIGDGFSSLLLIGFGLALADRLPGEHSFWFWPLLGLAILSKVKNYLKFSIGSGKEFAIFFANRSGAAAVLHRHNEKYPPTIKPGFNYKTSPVIESFVDGLLESHLKFLHKTLRLGFSLHGRDTYSASILVFDSKTQNWHRWRTVYEEGTAAKKVRPGSTWPKPKAQFLLDGDLYSYSKYKLFDSCKLPASGYEGVLTIPFYFRRAGRDAYAHEIRGGLYGAVSYTNSNPVTFGNVSSEKFLKYFALEAAALERVAFRIYRDYNF